MAKVVIIGPGHPLRGGLATFDHRLAREFIAAGDQCEIYSFSLQYPSFLFPGKTQYSDEAAPEDLQIHSSINSVNPFNWVAVGNKLKREKPDLIVVRYWLPFMGPAFGTILRRALKNHHTRVVCIADNITPHEHRPGDRAFTKYFINACHAFVTMSEKVLADLRRLEKVKPAQEVRHPLYDNFGEPVSKLEAREKLNLPQDERIVLFFGFIRRYKGLDLLLEAMSDSRIRKAGIKLLVAGEFYEDEKFYQDIIERHDIRSQLILRTEFIPDRDVRSYLCAADVVVQPYRNATQSGVTPLAYHFEKPMIVTRVGGLPDMVPDRLAGLVAEPDPVSIADALITFYEIGEAYFIPHLRVEKQKYSWSRLVDTIKGLASQAK